MKIYLVLDGGMVSPDYSFCWPNCLLQSGPVVVVLLEKKKIVDGYFLDNQLKSSSNT